MRRPSIWRYRAWTVIYAVWQRVAPKSYQRHFDALAAASGDESERAS